MSVYNVADYVGAAVESVLEQSVDDWELVITDDASTDGTLAVVERYDDPRIQIRRNRTNMGTYWNRNRALATARGLYFTTLDGDDTFMPDKLAAQLAALKDGGVACRCAYERDGPDARIQRDGHNTLLFDRSLIDEFGFYDTVRFGADTEYIRRIQRRYTIRSVREPLVRYRYRPDSLTVAPETSTDTGSPGADIRAAYRAHYGQWHQGEDLRLPFVQLGRRFAAGHRQQLGRREPITASLAVLPERRESLSATVNSLLRWADRVNVFVNGEMDDPPAVLRDPRVRVKWSSVNRGDHMKFWWSDQITEGYHFLCDDDLLYSAAYAERLIEKIERYDRKAIVGVHGSLVADGFADYYSSERRIHTFREAKEHDFRADFLGTGALAYHAGALRVPFACFERGNMADVFLGVHARESGVPLICVESPAHMIRKHPAPQARSIYAHCLETTAGSALNVREYVNNYLKARWR